MLDESERGVNVSFDDFPDEDNELLEEIAIIGDVVTIISSYRTYTVSIKDVDQKQIDRAKRILHKMNFDRRFKLKVV